MSTEATFKAYKVPHFTAKALEAAGVTAEQILCLASKEGFSALAQDFKLKPKTLISAARKMGVDEVIIAEYEKDSGLAGTGSSAGTEQRPDDAGQAEGTAEARPAAEAPTAVAADTPKPEEAGLLPDPAGALPVKPAKGKAARVAARAKAAETVKPLTAAERIKVALSAVKRKEDDSVGGIEVPLIGTAREFINSGVLHSEKIATPFPALNAILDGGIPRGRFTVVAGPEQSCKSTLTQCIVGEDQRVEQDGVWLWLDAEHSFDAPYAEKNGIDLDRLLVIQPDLMEHMCQRAIEVVITGAVRGIVIDSVGGFTPWEEVKSKRDDKEFITRTMAENNMAALAKRIGQFFRMMNVPAARTKTACILIGHVYTPIGDTYGPEFVVKGGNALKHWSHLRIMTRRKKGDQDEKLERTMPDGTVKQLYTAYEAVFTVDKTRQGAHYAHEVSIPYVYGTGLSNERSIIDMAFAYQIITAKGAWYGHRSFPERTPGQGDGWLQGRDKAEKYILEHPDVFSSVLKDVGAAIAASDSPGVAATPEVVPLEETHVV